MGNITKTKLIIRTILLITSTILIVFDRTTLYNIFNLTIIGSIKIYHIFWFYLAYEMLVVLFPKLSLYTYSGKHFKRHYIENKDYDVKKLNNFTSQNTKRALRAFTFWTALNGLIGFVYFKFDLDPAWMYWLFIFYYWSDMFCVNVWCPFHKIIVRNKCCNECRIYNWGHIMYLTPFVFIPNIWTSSLLLISFVIFIQWEYQNYKYPERFSSISNNNLKCSNCKNNCRFNPRKTNSKIKTITQDEYNIKKKQLLGI